MYYDIAIYVEKFLNYYLYKYRMEQNEKDKNAMFLICRNIVEALQKSIEGSLRRASFLCLRIQAGNHSFHPSEI